MKKTAKKKTRIESIVDLVDCHLDEEITKDELVEKLMTLVGQPTIVVVSEVKYKCTEWKDNIYLESLQEGQDDWVQVEDLTDLTVYEYNELVEKLNKAFPEYPIEYLEGRFV